MEGPRLGTGGWDGFATVTEVDTVTGLNMICETRLASLWQRADPVLMCVSVSYVRPASKSEGRGTKPAEGLGRLMDNDSRNDEAVSAHAGRKIEACVEGTEGVSSDATVTRTSYVSFSDRRDWKAVLSVSVHVS